MHVPTKSIVFVWILLQTCFIYEIRKKIKYIKIYFISEDRFISVLNNSNKKNKLKICANTLSKI